MPHEPEIVNHNEADERLFTIEELSWSLKASKNNKQPGPDNLPMGLLKWLNHENRTVLLHMINSWWRSKKAPEPIFRARVVPIF